MSKPPDADKMRKSLVDLKLPSGGTRTRRDPERERLRMVLEIITQPLLTLLSVALETNLFMRSPFVLIVLILRPLPRPRFSLPTRTAAWRLKLVATRTSL